MNSLGERIRSLRGKVSRKDFVQRFGSSPSSLSRWENNEAQPDLFFLSAIAVAYNISMDWLFFGKDVPHYLADEHMACGHPVVSPQVTDVPTISLAPSPVTCLFCGCDGSRSSWFFIQGPRLDILCPDEESVVVDAYICERCVDVCGSVLAEHRQIQGVRQ